MSIPKALFEELSSKLNDAIESNPIKDIEKNIKALITATLSKMDLVTKDDYAVQQKLLQKSLLKIAELEEKVNQLSPTTATKASIKTKTISKTTGSKNKP